jgi:hypothetical protein
MAKVLVIYHQPGKNPIVYALVRDDGVLLRPSPLEVSLGDLFPGAMPLPPTPSSPSSPAASTVFVMPATLPIFRVIVPAAASAQFEAKFAASKLYRSNEVWSHYDVFGDVDFPEALRMPLEFITNKSHAQQRATLTLLDFECLNGVLLHLKKLGAFCYFTGVRQIRVGKKETLTDDDLARLKSIPGVKRVDDEAGRATALFAPKVEKGAKGGHKDVHKSAPTAIILKSVTPVASWSEIILLLEKCENKISLPPPLRSSPLEAVFLAPPPLFAALSEPRVLGGVLVLSRLRDASF